MNLAGAEDLALRASWDALLCTSSSLERWTKRCPVMAGRHLPA